MKDINKMILLGRLGNNPILRHTKTGTPVAQFSVATTRKIFRDQSESPSEVESSPQEETQWHRVVAWGKQGENCHQYLKKGDPVYVEGFLRSHPYEAKDGTQKTTFEVYVETISFLGSRKHSNELVEEKLGESSVVA